MWTIAPLLAAGVLVDDSSQMIAWLIAIYFGQHMRAYCGHHQPAER
jgi:hypothetical protein